MTAPYEGLSLEDQLGRAKALLRIAELAFEKSVADYDHIDDELLSGAQISLAAAITIVGRLQGDLPPEALNATLFGKGARS